MHSSEPNPYAAPAAPLERELAQGEAPLAGRGSRLAAILVDGLLVGVPAAVALAAIGGWPGRAPPVSSTALPLVLFPAVSLALTGYQWYLVATIGQTVGKRLLGIRIVRLDGGRIGFVNGVMLRTWVLAVLAIIPFLGWVLVLADAVMIFTADRRCLHDYLAGSRVVRVERVA